MSIKQTLIALTGATALVLGAGLAHGKAHDQGVADGDRAPGDAPTPPLKGTKANVSGNVKGGVRGFAASDGKGGKAPAPE